MQTETVHSKNLEKLEIVMHCNLRPTDVAPVVFPFNIEVFIPSKYTVDGRDVLILIKTIEFGLRPNAGYVMGGRCAFWQMYGHCRRKLMKILPSFLSLIRVFFPFLPSLLLLKVGP